MMDGFSDSPDRDDGFRAVPDQWNPNLYRTQSILADAPFAAAGVAEQARRREEEPPPAPHPQGCAGAMDRAQHGFDLVPMRIEIGEPVERGALIMRAAPAPFLLDFEQVGILPDQVMARHHAAGEEMLGDPVIPVSAVEQVSASAMSEDVHEEAAVRPEP